MKIPYLDLGKVNGQLQPEIEQAALRAIRSGQYLYSDEIHSFEQQWAATNGAAYCVSTANGLDALTAAIHCLKTLCDWPDNSEVIVSAHTFIASYEAITRCNLKPVPCDVNPEDYNIDCSKITPLINNRTVAIMPVHIYGRPCDMPAIKDIADSHKLRIIADSCQLHTTHCSLSSLADATAFSFYPAKNMGAFGDAGCLVTNNPQLADLARIFCNYGATVKYHHEIKGVNSRMDSVQAAILSVKLSHLNEQDTMRQSQALRYNQGIKNPLIALPYSGSMDAKKSCWHVYPVFCDKRQQLQEWLASHGVGTIIHYPIPPHKQKAYTELNALTLPITEQICATELSLPLNPALTAEEQDYIIEVLNSFTV